MPRKFAAGCRRTRPVRPYRNLEAFLKSHGASEQFPYPCLTCRGRGTVYDPQDPPCRVEGNRNRNTIPCAACGGSGKGTKEACRKAYKAAIARFHEEAKAYNHLVQVRTVALIGLTEEQIHALKELGL